MADSVPNSFDVAIVGSGPAGYVAAIRAGQHGLRTVLIEKDKRLGGTCLHWGCIPTKAMLFSAQLLDHARDAESFGLKIPKAEVEMERVHAYKNGVITKMAGGIDFLMKKNKVTVLTGHGRLVGPGKLSVTQASGAPQTLEAKNVVIATGSVVKSLPGFDFDGTSILSSDQVMTLDRVPKRVAVLGGGAVGVEFASVFRSFGAEVSVIELMPTLLPLEDEDCGKLLARAFKKRKIDVWVQSKVEKQKGGVKLTVAAQAGSTQTLEADFLLSAVGRRPLTEDVGLDKIGLKPDPRGFIAVDSMMRTSVPNVFAIGDVVAGSPMLAHVGSAEGITAVDFIAGKHPKALNYAQMPSCTYCAPQVATVGLTEKKAKELGHQVKTGLFPFSALGKATILRETEGFVKIVADQKYNEVLGVHMVGPDVTDLLAEGGLALTLESTLEEIAHTVHAHPTLSEAVAEAAHAALGEPIHI